jgi:hypothetical protein
MEGARAMPAYQNPKAHALMVEALALYEEARSAPTQAEQERLREQAAAKEREADRIEGATR